MTVLESALVPSGTLCRPIDGFRRGDQLKTITFLEIETFYDDPSIIKISIALFNIIRYCCSERRATSLILETEFIKMRFRACEIIRIIGFLLREVQITFTQMAAACTFNVDHSAIQGALESDYEDSPARRQRSEFSGDKYHTGAG
jgi:hypothetical protein